MSGDTNRRGFLAVVASIAVGAGCYERKYRTTGVVPGGGGGSSTETTSTDLLEIAPETTVSLVANNSNYWSGINWSTDQGLLELEPDAELRITNSEADNA